MLHHPKLWFKSKFYEDRHDKFEGRNDRRDGFSRDDGYHTCYKCDGEGPEAERFKALLEYQVYHAKTRCVKHNNSLQTPTISIELPGFICKAGEEVPSRYSNSEVREALTRAIKSAPLREVKTEISTMIKFTEVTLRDMMEPFMHVLFSVQENMTRQFAKVEALDNFIAGIKYVKIKKKR